MSDETKLNELLQILMSVSGGAGYTKQRYLAAHQAAVDYFAAEVARLTAAAEHNGLMAQAEKVKRLEAEADAERFEDALQRIASWSDAYPLSVFPEPDFKKVQEWLGYGGITLDSVSASNMRHVVEGVGKIAKDALKGGEDESAH